MRGVTVVQSFEFPVQVDGPDGDANECVAVLVYETQRDMVLAANEFNGVQDPEEVNPPWGFTQGYGGGGLLTEEPRATIRLCRPALLRTVALHELIHATQWVYNWGRLNRAEGNPWDINNEHYAYLVQHSWEFVNEGIDWTACTHPDGPDASGPDIFTKLEKVSDD